MEGGEEEVGGGEQGGDGEEGGGELGRVGRRQRTGGEDVGDKVERLEVGEEERSLRGSAEVGVCRGKGFDYFLQELNCSKYCSFRICCHFFPKNRCVYACI